MDNHHHNGKNVNVHDYGSSHIKHRRRALSIQDDDRLLILPPTAPCKYCGAYKFYRETEKFCCSGGEIKSAETKLPEYIVHLITSTDPECIEFQNMIRTYNNHFAFTTIGLRCDELFERRDRGIYTVRVQGQVHHFLDDLMPQDSLKKLTGIQFYFYDATHQATNRLSVLPRLDESIVEKLVAQMENNPYTLFLKHASTFENIDNYHIVIRSNPGLDQREYSRPTCSEVADIWIEDESGENELSEPYIRVYTKSGSSHKVQYYYACYDPLQYVLMFPHGEPGWHGNIPRVGCTIRSKMQMNAL